MINTSSSCLQESEFDYEQTKNLFYERVQSYYTDDNSRKWTQALIEKTITDINEAKTFHKSTGRWHNEDHFKLASKYNAIKENGKDILIKRTKNVHSAIIQIVPYEDYFDIILEAHKICGHSNEKTSNLIKPSYYIPQLFIKVFIQLCKVCQRRKIDADFKPSSKAYSKSVTRFNCIVQIGFINMKKQPDGTFDYILYYVDKMSGYILLRATLSNKNEFEISMELLKIFLDFGPPKQIETMDYLLLDRAMNLLNRTWRIWDIIVTPLPALSDHIFTPKMLARKIEKWMTENKTGNWAVGCRIIQMHMNTTQSGKNCTPFDSVFGFKSNHTPFSTKNKRSNKVSSEEDDTGSEENLSFDETSDAEMIDNDDDVEMIEDNNGDNQCSKSQEAKNTMIDKVGSAGYETLRGLLSNSIEKCNVCHNNIFKPFTCFKCEKPTHLFCCKRLVQCVNDDPVLQTVCLLCKENNRSN